MKTPLILLTLVCLAAPAAAQPAPPPGEPLEAPAASRTRFGIRAGLNLSTIRSDDFGSIDVSTKFGFAAGGVLAHELNPNLSIVVEGLFTQKGAKFSDGTDSATASYSYIEVPFVGAYSFPGSGSMTPFVYAGGAVAYFLSGEISSGGQSADLTDVNSIDFGVVAGAGAKFATSGTGTGVVDVRYTLGLNDIADQGEGSAQHGVLSVMGGYLF